MAFAGHRVVVVDDGPAVVVATTALETAAETALAASAGAHTALQTAVALKE
jgi:hypothetical protein